MKENTEGWMTHNGGECPIPDAKAGEYELEFRDWEIYKPLSHAYSWGWTHDKSSADIIAYRLIEVQK